MRPIVMAVAALAALAACQGASAQPGLRAGVPAGVPDAVHHLALSAPVGATGAAGAAGIVMVGAPAGVKPGAGQPGPTAPGPGSAAVTIDFDFDKTCRASDQAVIRSAFERAAAGLERGVALIQREPNHPHFTEWFGSAPTETVLRVYTAIIERMRSPEPVHVVCWSGSSCSGGVFAFTSNGEGTPTMGFCETFFNAADQGYDSRPGTVVHEMSHLAAGTSDIVYGVDGAHRLAGAKGGNDAANNADNFEYFIESLPADR